MKLLDKFRIHAPEESVADSPTLLTFFDAIWIDSPPIQSCFFYSYPHSTSQFLESYLPNIKCSLSLTLQHFYPLAGKLRLSPDSEEQYEIYYKDGDSISMKLVESEDDFVEVSGSKPHDSSKIQPLVPELSGDDLLAIQLTIFPNHGICVGVSIHHAACDGFSYTHFVKSWASICMSGLPLPSTMVPSVDDRTLLLGSFHENYIGCFKAKQEYGHLFQKPEAKIDTFNSTILRFSPEQIEMLKASVQAKAKSLQRPLPYCSTYVVSSVYTWSCYAKLRKYSDDQTVCFMLPVDWRKRLEPPAPPLYFGNCVYHSSVEMKAGDLVMDDGFTIACEAVGNKVKDLESGIMSILQREVEGHPRFALSFSNKFGVYGVEFGWGQPIKFEQFSWKANFSMAENGDESKGVEIGVVLPKHEMEEFITIFTTSLPNYPFSCDKNP